MRNETIGIVGLGAMGQGIAQLFAQAGFFVIATDTVAEAREAAPARIAAALDKRVAARKLSSQERDEALARLHIAEKLDEMAGCSLVIEVIIERLDAKQALFAALEGIVACDAILATNTSSLSVGAIAATLAAPERLIGLHFFNPAPVMKLVELVAAKSTGVDALNKAEAIARAAGKVVIRCADTPGFIVNRCARPYYGEALTIVEAGDASPDVVDAAMVAAGYRLGPFGLIDLVGADINLAATETVSAAMNGHPRYHVFDLLRQQVAKGALGRKSENGFLDGDLPEIPAELAATIALRIEATLANEAAWLLAEGGTTRDDIDVALKLGLNFPRGPFESARLHGYDRIVEILEALEREAPAHLKGRYVPSPLLAGEGS